MRLCIRVLDWSRASLARVIGFLSDRLCLCAQALWRRLDRCCSVCLWKVIRISQSSYICTLWHCQSLLCCGSLWHNRAVHSGRLAHERHRRRVIAASDFLPGGSLASRRTSDVLSSTSLCAGRRLMLCCTGGVCVSDIS